MGIHAALGKDAQDFLIGQFDAFVGERKQRLVGIASGIDHALRPTGQTTHELLFNRILF